MVPFSVIMIGPICWYQTFCISISIYISIYVSISLFIGVYIYFVIYFTCVFRYFPWWFRLQFAFILLSLCICFLYIPYYIYHIVLCVKWASLLNGLPKSLVLVYILKLFQGIMYCNELRLMMGTGLLAYILLMFDLKYVNQWISIILLIVWNKIK